MAGFVLVLRLCGWIGLVWIGLAWLGLAGIAGLGARVLAPRILLGAGGAAAGPAVSHTSLLFPQGMLIGLAWPGPHRTALTVQSAL